MKNKKRKKIIIRLILIILIYLCLVFLIPLLFFPGFLRDVEIQRTENLRQIAEQFKAEEKEETMKNVCNFVEEKYLESGYKLFVLLNRHFYTNVEKIINKEQYTPCHVQSLIVKTLLINTGQFQEENFEKKIIMLPWGVIHRYDLIKINNKTFKADPYFDILEEIK